MQTDDEVGKVAAPVPVIISRALELFVEALVKNSSEITKARNAKTLTTSHLKACILADSHFQFLHELVSNVPDVQGDEDCPLPVMPIQEGQQTPVIVRHRSTRGRKPKNRNGESNAGPSHSTAEESESEDEEEDEDEDDDSDCASSENTCDNSSVDSRPLVINHESDISTPFNRIHNSIEVTNNNVEEDDDDYDS